MQRASSLDDVHSELFLLILHQFARLCLRRINRRPSALGMQIGATPVDTLAKILLRELADEHFRRGY